MQLCQMLIQGMWITDSPLLQVVDKPTASALQQSGVQAIGDFANLPEEEIKTLLKGKDMEKIARACNRYPAVTMSHEVIDE